MFFCSHFKDISTGAKLSGIHNSGRRQYPKITDIKSMALVNISTKKVWKCFEAARNEPTTAHSVSPWRPAVVCPSCSPHPPTPTGVFGGAIRFYAPLCTVVEWVPHSQVACGDRPIWAHLLLIRRTDPPRPPPPHPAPPPPNIARVKVREMRSSKLSRETVEAPDGADVHRRRACCCRLPSR